MMGVMDELFRQGQAGVAAFNRAAGFLINPFDVAGVAVLISAGPRLARVWKVAALGACLGIAVRTVFVFVFVMAFVAFACSAHQPSGSFAASSCIRLWSRRRLRGR